MKLRTSRSAPSVRKPGAKDLHSACRQSARELAVLREISETVSCNLNLDEVLRRTVDVVVGVTRADACLFYLLDRRGAELVLRASKNPHPRLIGRITLGVGEGITGWVAKTKKPVAIPRNASEDPRFKFFHNLPEDKYQAFLSVPVTSKNDVIGVINVQHKKPHPHTDGEIGLLTAIGQQVGGAIDNARLYEEMRRKARQLETLSKVSTTIASDRYLEEILHLIVTMTAEMMDSKICSIMLLDEKNGELVIKATQSLSPEYKSKQNLKIGQSISGRAVEAKRPIVVLDVQSEPGYMYPELARREGVRSLLSVPMMIKNRAIGVINSYTSGIHHFTEEEVRILQGVANQAAVAIENTKLLEKSVAMEEALKARKAVERAKGILTRQRGISEEEAFRLIQKQSMNSRRTMKEVADAILLAADLRP